MQHEKFSWESGARSYSRSVPQIFSRAEGCHLYDRNGKKYLDFLCGAGTLLLGHNHPAIVSAIQGVSQPIMNNLDLRTEAEEKFANTLLPLLPFSCKTDEIRLHFCGPTGGDAVEAALKLAVIKTGRRGVFAFSGSYHGMGQGALSVSSSHHYRDVGLRVQADVTFLPYPYPYRFPEPYNTEAAATQFCLAHLEMLLEDDHSGVSLPAAIIIEPMQGEGGNIPAPPEFLKKLRAMCDKHGIVLILDEIQSGLGRCGEWFGCSGIVEPDIVCISKGIGGGFPMALIAFKQDMNVWHPADHIGTFRGQQYAMTAGQALLATIQNENLLANVKARHQQMSAALRDIAKDTALIGQVRGRGLYMGIEVDKNFENPGMVAKSIKVEMLARGIVMECGGRQGAVLRVLCPLNITSDIAQTFLEALHESIKTVEQNLPSAKTMAKAA
ncbi:MAG: aminotransferase class III-fold pyridoxal phosphate-dependent enzyme [Proteobacteria bacterium]|nr:aminotransferase class III-fold pyridoxal phosphate-dependent enzyme [Pseudomonadota bacterium]